MPTAAYIGPLAHLTPIQYVSEVRVRQEGRYAVTSARSRTWAYVTGPADRPAPRTWETTLLCDNASLAVLEGMGSGAYGDGPFRWVPESAYVSNLLTPRDAHMMAFNGPGVDSEEGWSPRSHIGPAAVTLAADVPALPGAPFTASVDASGPAELRVLFRSANGELVKEDLAVADGAGMRRLHCHIAETPVAARTADIIVSEHGQVTHPQVTWVNRPTPWAAGAGSQSVIVESVESSARQLDYTGGLLHNVVVQMSEVG